MWHTVITEGHLRWHAYNKTALACFLPTETQKWYRRCQDFKEKGFQTIRLQVWIPEPSWVKWWLNNSHLWSCSSATLLTHICSSPAVLHWLINARICCCVNVNHEKSIAHFARTLWCCTSSKPLGSKRQLRPTEIEAYSSGKDDFASFAVLIRRTDIPLYCEHIIAIKTHIIHAF